MHLNTNRNTFHFGKLKYKYFKVFKYFQIQILCILRGWWNAIRYQILDPLKNQISDPPKNQISDITHSQKSDIWL